MLSILFSLVLFETFVTAYDFYGCFSYPNALDGQVGEWLGIFGASCPDTCTAQGKKYSYEYDKWRGRPGIDQYCYCTDTPPDFQYIEDGWENCEPGYTDFGDVTVSAHLTPFTFNYCTTSPNTLELSTPVQTVFECFDHCGSHTYARLYFNGGEPQGNCFCYDDNSLWATRPRTTCNLGDWYIYQRDVQPSSLVKRQKARLESERKHRLCPEGLTACGLSSVNDDYECIDILSDPESCGGCITHRHGVHEELRDGTQGGTDCTALAGVLATGVVCSVGQCEILACEEGHVLKDQICVPLDGHQAR
ncbi:uncharacterized protein I303_103909 [Kwoniella dejecticola CBS 10117]|uniref:Protein CPL1-like domain-containing protein n=1 Tax=Kwoniella dejecticola CBS 10117 TaxID=1296121 RepID=A0A1A6A824_9TREE|nr:uncharacterized protein I303_03927 [Kwoniella dejecticola CBS 10117]OBR86207.1 hypothetical protein I303_03927 [Kwoniella dejecticola CBS 10117]